LDGLIEDNSLNIASTIPAISVAALSQKRFVEQSSIILKRLKLFQVLI
jgi:hypothetical protein